MSPLSDYTRSLWNGERNALQDKLLIFLLLLPSLLYGLAMRIRSLIYCYGLLRTNRLPRPVISVGNITVGGTGKTPVIAYIAGLLIKHGLRVTVLTRGYGGSLEGSCAVVSDGVSIMLSPAVCGDEPYLLASTIPGLSVVIGADRYSAGLLAMDSFATDIFLLDDGFQHIRLHRDMNILLLDAERPFGNGLTIPAGGLREPLSACGRADLVVYTRHSGQFMPECKFVQALPSCAASYRISSFYRIDSSKELMGIEMLKRERFMLFAGIARPASFFSAVSSLGLTPCVLLPLPDHEPYTPEIVSLLRRTAVKNGAIWLVTTEKDAVKLNACNGIDDLNILAARLELVFPDDRPLLSRINSVLGDDIL